MKIDAVLTNSKIIRENYRPDIFSDAELSDQELQVIFTEIEEYRKALRTFLNFNNHLPVNSDKNNKLGRKPKKFSFNCTLSNDQLEQLFILILERISNLDESEFIIQDESSDMEHFKELLKSKDFNALIANKWTFKFGLINKYVSFIFTWLEKNKKMHSSFLAIEKSDMFYSIEGKKITAEKLRQGFKGIPKVFDYNKKLSTCPSIDPDSETEEICNYLHFKLSEIIKVR